MLSGTQFVVVMAVLAAGLLSFVRVAQREVADWHLKNFFLGGGKIGPDLTEHNTLGITFAWSGGIFFFAFAAYGSGPWVMLLQLAWCASIMWLALLLPRIIVVLRGTTIHGYMARHYGEVAQIAAALATTFGYFINAGYEFYFSALMLSGALGRPLLLLPMALVFGLIAAAYCAIGGYRSNARTDKPQNLLGVAALAFLVVCLVAEVPVPPVLRYAGIAFGIGSGIYIVLSLLHDEGGRKLSMRTLNIVAIGFAVVGYGLMALLVGSDDGKDPVLASATLPPYLLTGLLSFQVFFNVVDMQNWQQIAANEDLPPEAHKPLSWSIVRASLYLFWFPALGGTLIGLAMRAQGAVVSDQTFFPMVFQLLLPDLPDIARAVVLGLVALGLVATSLSTFDSLLMSALQTIRYDLFGRRALERIRAAGAHSGEAEQLFVRRSRSMLLPLSAAMIISFYFIYKAYPTQVLNLQAVMYAAPLTLLAPVLLALFSPAEAQRARALVRLGLVTGLVGVMVVFGLAMRDDATDWQRNWLPNLTPALALASTTLPVLLVLLASLFRTRKTQPGSLSS